MIGFGFSTRHWQQIEAEVYVSEDEERCSFQYEHDPKRMSAGLKNYAYCIHPAFRLALGCSNGRYPLCTRADRARQKWCMARRPASLSQDIKPFQAWDGRRILRQF